MRLLLMALTLALSSAALAQVDPRAGEREPGYSIPGSRDSGAGRRLEPGRSFRGEVQGVDKISGTVTLRHGPIGALGIPARTMEYEVKNGSLLEHLKVGDEVRFVAVMQGRSLLVTDIAPAN